MSTRDVSTRGVSTRDVSAIDHLRRALAGMRLWRSSLALAAAFLVAIGGLIAADRALTLSRRSYVRVSAAESAAFVEGFLDLHIQALQSLRGLPLGASHAVVDSAFQEMMDVMQYYAPSFRRVWLTDSAGVVRYERVFGGSPGPILLGVALDTVSRLGVREMARRGRQEHSTQISRPGALFTGRYGFFILQPIMVGRRFRGFAGGSLTQEAVLATIHAHDPHPGVRHIVLAGTDTMAADPPVVSGPPQAWRTPVGAPGAAEWRIEVQGEAPGWRRTALWSVGLAMLATLFIALVHERRQGLRLAGRSAELERLSMELLHANRTKSEFLNNISHELRTPLNAIVGFAEMLREGVYGELAPRQRNPVERIASSAAHLRHLVDQILDLAKITAGRVEVHPEWVDLRAMVLDIASEVEPLVEARGLHLTLNIGGSIPRLRTDPSHVRQILLNLVGNAIKYTPSGGLAVRARVAAEHEVPGWIITGSAHPAPQWVALGIADTGVGIATVDFERIFDEFEQVNAGSRGSSMQRGTGLGLPISRRLARLIGGEITLESEPGQGSTFTLWLPVGLADAASSSTTTDSATPATPAESAEPRVPAERRTGD